MHFRKKLPSPDLSKVRVVPSDLHVDEPELHGCRKRSFPHVRGNWATFVYIICMYTLIFSYNIYTTIPDFFTIYKH